MIQGGSFDRVEIARQLAVAPAFAPMIMAEPERGRPAGETLQSKMPAIDWSLTGHPDLAPKCLLTPQLPNYAEFGADV